jgi:hypothetical protein
VESRPYCYPVCLACRVAVCPKAITPTEPQTPRADQLASKRLKCGCLSPQVPITLGVLNPTAVMCNRHGWQPLPEKGSNESKGRSRRTKASAKEKAPEGQDGLFETGNNGEEIPF